MNEIDLEEMKNLQVAMLDEFSSFCDRHGLVYFLAGGTLLGAIRHKGYIPWDDDIDVAMPRADYERFLETFHQENYIIKSPYCDKSYYYPFAKVVDKRTLIIERSDENTNLGVYIDIFPIDSISKNKVKGYHIKRKIVELIMTSRMAQKDKKRGVFKRILIYLFRGILYKADLNKLAIKVDTIVRKYGREENKCELAGILVWGEGAREAVPKEFFEGYKEAQFESNTYKIPIKAHEYLTATFGDYMKLPPVEKRVRHDVKAFWK